MNVQKFASNYWHSCDTGFVQGGNRNNFETKEECDEICVHPEGKKVSEFIKSIMLLPSLFISILFARLAIYQWYQDLAKAHISTMVTIASEGSVNNSNTGAVLVSL